MFYSHEVLTSREYGVATVWLVATLGSQSNSKKVNRKAILEVDVPKACRTIVDPVAPMALRLQGNLLYGVSRVHLQQCGYVLSDAQNAYNAIHMMLRAVRSAELDPQAGKARPEQLILQDDPSFLPELALPPPELLAELDLGPVVDPPRNGDSQSLDPSSSQNPTTPEFPVGGLIIPSSSSVNAGEFVFDNDIDSGAIEGHNIMLAAEHFDEPSFSFDNDGNLIDFEPANTVAGTPTVDGGPKVQSDAGGSARVRQEHEERLQAGTPLNEKMDLDLPMFDDDLPEGEAFTASPQQQLGDVDVEESSSAVAAPARRRNRAARTIPLDTAMELRNKDLADWNTNYLQNMREAVRLRTTNRSSRLAKKNAEYYVWGVGIGGIGERLPSGTGPSPFEQFMGDNLFELFTGIDRKGVAGTKHDHDSGIDDATQEESRNVRQKTGHVEDEVGRGQDDEAMFIPGGDVELPREAPSALEDHNIFSAMPWNLIESTRGSSVFPRSAQTGLAGSAGAPSSLTGRPVGRDSRLVPTSPLHGRGQPSGLVTFDEAESDNFEPGDFGIPCLRSDFAEAASEAQHVRVREALSAEGENFLGFVASAIDKKRDRIQAELQIMSDPLQADAAGDIDEISFAELLPHEENTKMVASQAFMMALTLGNRGLLHVRQGSTHDEVTLSLSHKAKASRFDTAVADVHSGSENGGGSDQEHGGFGQLEEQFTADRAGLEAGKEREDIGSRSKA